MNHIDMPVTNTLHAGPAATPKASAFQLLCAAATQPAIEFKLAVAIDAAIKETKEGDALVCLIKQYNEGLITLVEFRNAFVEAALA